MFSASDVKELRERTGCGMMDCKKEITETNGDMEKAIEFLREKGLAAAAKKSGRIAAEGIVAEYIENNIGVILEVNSETDFVSKNAEFQTFAKNVAQVVAKQNPADTEALLKLPYSDAMSVEEMLREKILTIGENLNIRRFARYEGNVVSYIHGGGRIGVMVRAEAPLEGEAYEAARDAAMQIAAINPLYLNVESIPAEDVEKERAIILAQIKNDPASAKKPDNIIEKMVDGRIGKFYNENCLLEQDFVKNSDVKVGAYLASKGVKLVEFIRFEKGEGIQKKEDNFADEVANMIK